MSAYERAFAATGVKVAQVLLTRDDLADRRRYLNAKHACVTLLELARVPDRQRERHRRRRGDQARRQRQPLGADGDPGRGRPAGDPERRRRPVHRRSAPRARRRARPVVERRRRRRSRRWPASAGRSAPAAWRPSSAPPRRRPPPASPPIIADGRRPGVLAAVLDPARATSARSSGRSRDRLARRKHWIAYTLKPGGHAASSTTARARAIVEQRPEPAAVGPARGARQRSASAPACSCLDLDGREFARGLVSYSAAELDKIKGAPLARDRAHARLQDERRGHPSRRSGALERPRRR